MVYRLFIDIIELSIESCTSLVGIPERSFGRLSLRTTWSSSFFFLFSSFSFALFYLSFIYFCSRYVYFLPFQFFEMTLTERLYLNFLCGSLHSLSNSLLNLFNSLKFYWCYSFLPQGSSFIAVFLLAKLN